LSGASRSASPVFQIAPRQVWSVRKKIPHLFPYGNFFDKFDNLTRKGKTSATMNLDPPKSALEAPCRRYGWRHTTAMKRKKTEKPPKNHRNITEKSIFSDDFNQ
jgi:hypothetical protein